jgi:hypothetical protein
MKYLMMLVVLLAGCASNNPADSLDIDVFKKYQCEKDKKLAEDSGSGIIIDCSMYK